MEHESSIIVTAQCKWDHEGIPGDLVIDLNITVSIHQCYSSLLEFYDHEKVKDQCC